MKRTKIVVTLGPATDTFGVLDTLVSAGLDAARLNYSHGSRDEQARRAKEIREVAAKRGKELALIADLQGPKIRLECFEKSSVYLKEDDRFVIDVEHPEEGGTNARVGVTYKDLPKDISPGDTLLVDDGRLVFSVERVTETTIETKVIAGGKLSDHKGINRLGGGLSAPALTDKDRRDLTHAIAHDADYIAVSFPRSAKDIKTARDLISAEGGKAGIIAKIERAEAIELADEIIAASDCIMIARGDLGVEIGDERLPPAQKILIAKARAQHKTVITATQMMESMINNPIPTRAEVSDVANAVLDGTDAVMLSGETSVGSFPVKAVEAMARVCRGVENEWKEPAGSVDQRDRDFDRVDQAIAMSAIYCSNRIGVKAIVALTESGLTALWMSRINTNIPIFAISRHPNTLRKVALYRDVYPIQFDVGEIPYTEVTREILNLVKKHGGVRNGDRVMITKGDLHGHSGGTNGMKIVTVGDFVEHVG